MDKQDDGPGPGKYQSTSNETFGKKTWNVKFGYLGAVREDGVNDEYQE